jgi:hypothetical protein
MAVAGHLALTRFAAAALRQRARFCPGRLLRKAPSNHPNIPAMVAHLRTLMTLSAGFQRSSLKGRPVCSAVVRLNADPLSGLGGPIGARPTCKPEHKSIDE